MTRRWVLLGYIMALGLAAGCGGNGNRSEDIITEVAPGAELDSVQMEKVVLAWVGDSPIAVSDLRHHMLLSTGPNNLESYMKNPDIVNVALGALVDQYVWGEKAEKEGYDLTPAERRNVDAMRMEFLATRYVGDVIQEKCRPTREEVEAYYNEHQDKYLVPPRVAIRHIQVKTREEAEDIKQQIDNGADFIEMVQKYSVDYNTKDLDGALGYLQKGSVLLGIGQDDNFERAVLPMNVGEVGIAQSDVGWHVVRVDKKEGGVPKPLDEVYQQISDAMVADRFNEVYAREAEAAREEMGVRYVVDNMEVFTGVTNSPKRIMMQAQNVSDPGGRLTLYRRVAFNFPDDPLAPEAQFRIAYTLYADMKDMKLARKALGRLDELWPDSEWRKAGDYLSENLLQRPEVLGTPEDILRRVQSESSGSN